MEKEIADLYEKKYRENSWEREIVNYFISQEKEKWIEELTENLDTKKMLPGWERYWKEVRPGRFVCMCGECDNGDRIIKLLQK